MSETTKRVLLIGVGGIALTLYLAHRSKKVLDFESELEKGADIEGAEHNIDYQTAKKIAEDHLKEDINYYN